ncbi:MAG: CDP-glycerol glycerophosphotransferase family protein [Clostridia bacterium]|nr:CDP-glycerol glycerophosphotransferase family protein [Clostridia bacterium]
MKLVQLIRKNPLLLGTVRVSRMALGRSYMSLCRLFGGIHKKRVFVSSFQGNAYSDSPRFISEALHAIAPDAEIVWQLSANADMTDVPDYVRIVRPHSAAALRELSTCGAIVDNFNRPFHLLKFKGQYLVETWHGDRGFKKMMYDMNDGLKYPDYRQMDLAVAGSDFGVSTFRTAYRYEGEVLKGGMPRNDCLVNRDMKGAERARLRLGLPEGTKVLLYAPTFRDTDTDVALKANFDPDRAVQLLEQSTGEKWIVITRAHERNTGVDAGRSGAIDCTKYPEMSDLLLLADLLITDYSSSAGDYILLDRPVILYQPDLDRFMRNDREMYFDLRTCPYTRAESEAELEKMLADFGSVSADQSAVRAFYGVSETGRSAEAVAERIAAHIHERK